MTPRPLERLAALAALACLLLTACPAWARVEVPFAFAPQEGPVAPPEQPLRAQMCLNGSWRFQPVTLPAGWRPGDGPPEMPPPDPAAWDPTPLRVPSPWNVNSFAAGEGGDFRSFPSYPAAWEEAKQGWLARSFRVPETWRGQRVWLRFAAVAGRARVLLNGRPLGERFDSFLPWELDVTGAVNFGGENRLLVGVAAPELMDTPGKLRHTYPAGSFWGQHIAGIWQDVYLVARPRLSVTDAFVQPLLDQDKLNIQLDLANNTDQNHMVSVVGRVYEWVNLAGVGMAAAPEPRWRLGREVLTLPARRVEAPAGARVGLTLEAPAAGRLAAWSPDAPRLYGLLLEVSDGDKIIDRHYVRFGWRQFSIAGKKLLLNGRPLQLLADAWHFAGIPQMTRRYAWAWYSMLKAAHGNAVRLHAQPFPAFYLDLADEMGVCVLDETAIWASHCGLNFDHPDFWARSRRHVAGLVERDRNHPSVFGYSLANEITGALGVTRASDNDVRRVQYQAAGLARLARKLDPTRPWLSSDGDGDLMGRLPVSVLHYGDSAKLAGAARASRKPLGIGEAGAAYDGTPVEVSRWGGDLAYADFAGRMEGVAREAYDLIARGQRPEAAFCSVFNLVWYGLKPLALGLPDPSRAPTPADGVFFPPLAEGVAGVQPERLGPYCTTLNPGYDPSLPLYEPWPLLAAVADAFAPGGAAPSRWGGALPAAGDPPPPPAVTDRPALWGDPDGGLARLLKAAGARPIAAVEAPQAPVLVIDCPALAGPRRAEVAASARRTLAAGGVVLVWGLTPGCWDPGNGLLPAPLTLTQRDAVSLTPAAGDPLTAGLSHRMLYFAEDPMRQRVMVYGQDGPAARAGRALLSANPTDWRRWNHQPEMIKTASVLRGERETLPGGAALVAHAAGPGRLLTGTLDLTPESPGQVALLRRLLANLGVRLGLAAEEGRLVVDDRGRLRAALALGPLEAADYRAAFRDEPLAAAARQDPRAGVRAVGAAWRAMDSDAEGRFDLRREWSGERGDDCAAYLSFWLHSPRPLDDLLTSPDVPRLNLFADSDDGLRIWLNGALVVESGQVQGLGGRIHESRALAIRQGWNHFLVKVAQSRGDWAFSLKLDSSDPAYLRSLTFALERPR